MGLIIQSTRSCKQGSIQARNAEWGSNSLNMECIKFTFLFQLRLYIHNMTLFSFNSFSKIFFSRVFKEVACFNKIVLLISFQERKKKWWPYQITLTPISLEVECDQYLVDTIKLNKR